MAQQKQREEAGEKKVENTMNDYQTLAASLEALAEDVALSKFPSGLKKSTLVAK